MHPIDPSTVSVVFSGPVSAWTSRALTSARAHLPGAQVVLSTWRGTVPGDLDVTGVDVVESEDPGGGPRDVDASGNELPPMNTQRMFTSSRAGLARAGRPHVLKTRSDAVLTGAEALGWTQLAAHATRSAFQQRVLTCSVATRPASSQLLHHLSDCFHFGLREDVTALWNGDVLGEEENHGFWSRQGRATPWMWDARYANEQLLWLGFLRARGIQVDYPFLGAAAPAEEAERSTRLIVENFVVLEPWQLGLSLPKLDPVVRVSARAGYLSFDEWLEAERRLRPAR
ncbi:WavE lipopolysaccharide synthesis family protein [Kineococcus sp. SYSU DK006]|uniref:WavE lipopolysaccharide synthesis family protein n=1 Tax=Kineococcus sp. SYSU DK006 TaxID=3383127 RepID=UPI003D7DB48A